MKIKKIKVKNFKSISENEINLNGCSAIVTAGNNKGKTTLLRGLIDRIQSEKPDMIIKKGEKDGFATMELTDGSHFEWIFSEKKEVLSYTTKDNFKVDISKGAALKDIQNRFFPSKFDIDIFLASQPKKQVEILQKLVGIDFTSIDNEYKLAFDERTIANREYERLKAINLTKPIEVSKPNLNTLKARKIEISNKIQDELKLIKEKNNEIRKNWENENEKLRTEIENFNKIQQDKTNAILNLTKEFNSIQLFSFSDCFDYQKANLKISSLPIPENQKTFAKLPEPKFENENINNSELIEIEKEIEIANQQNIDYNIFVEKQKQYNDWINFGKAAKENAAKLNEKVKEIETRKKEMISGAKFPNGFEIIDGEIKVNGFSLQKNQISTSRLYIAALQLASMELGEVKSLHFDCSTLDKNSLKEVIEWAEKEGLQLLIEKPDFEAGEIKYEIINE